MDHEQNLTGDPAGDVLVGRAKHHRVRVAPRLAPSRALSPAGTLTSKPAVAVSDGGRVLVAWDSPQGADTDRIEARLGRVGNAWGATEVLSRDGESPVAAVGPDGTAVVAWTKLGSGERREGRSAIYIAVAAPGHRFGMARLVASGTHLSAPVSLEIRPDGEAVVVWSRRLPVGSGVNSTVREDVDFALLAPDSSRPRVGRIAVAGYGLFGITETDSGVVLVAFATPLDLSPFAINQQAAVAALPVGASTFAAPQTIYAEPGNPYAEIRQAALAAGPSGAGLTFANILDELQPSGALGSSVKIAESPQEATEREVAERESFGLTPTTGTISTEALGAAFPADGARVAAWQRTRALTPVGGTAWSRVMVAVRPADAGSFGDPVRLSFGKGLAGEPQIAAAGATTLVLWTQNTQCTQQVFAAVRPPDGAFSRATAVSSRYRPQQDECLFGNGQPALAGSARYAIAAWVQGRRVRVTTLTGEG